LLGTAKALVDDGATPACQVAVARDGELLAFETFGAATNDNRFTFFSATKPIVASVMWLLIADGLVDVQRPVAEYVDEFGANGLDVVTVEQVMLHTAGFPNAPMHRVDGADPVRRRKRFSSWTLEWEPGTRFEYHAESAHWVLADIIERVTGDDFRDALEQRVCAPLGLPRVLGITVADQRDVAPCVALGDPGADTLVELMKLNDPNVREAGVPAAGGILTAATMARFYQALLHNPGGLWDPAVLDDAKANVRCRFDDPLLGVPANRSLGLVLAGDDGLHQFRYGMFGAGNSPATFGHSGAGAQVAWADPATGLSFAFTKNGLAPDMVADHVRIFPLSDLAAQL
jgi:CubicO group peptidase (beta-lactamase class C family)